MKRGRSQCEIPLVKAPLALVLCLLALCLTVTAQVAVPVGAGSYASFVPSFDGQADEYYGLGAEQIIDLYPTLHLDPSLTNRPLPSNKWWTDMLIGDRSGNYNPTNNPPRAVLQNPFGGNLWAYPVMLAPEFQSGLTSISRIRGTPAPRHREDLIQARRCP